MLRIQFATTDKEILEFEKLRTLIFYNKKINNMEDTEFGEYIKKGDYLALQCVLDDKIIGGILLMMSGYDLLISRVFVDSAYRRKGIAKLLIDYVINNKNIIEEKMGTELNDIITEPKKDVIEHSLKMGFEWITEEPGMMHRHFK